MVTVHIRPLQQPEEYRAAEAIQQAVWDIDARGITPDHVMITAHKNGGLVLGAFAAFGGADEQALAQLIGFLYGFVGLTPGGQVKHCSHMLGVLPEYWGQQVGYRLKLAQREFVLAQGIDLITWTYDPLESRNAYLNMHKLGTVCHTYLRDVYGNMGDALNRGLPSDRFEVQWHIRSAHVTRCLQQQQQSSERSQATIINAFVPDTLPSPAATTLPMEHDVLRIQVPDNFQAIKTTDRRLAGAWREHTRGLFERAFAAGYTVTDVAVENQQWYYLLEKHWSSV